MPAFQSPLSIPSHAELRVPLLEALAEHEGLSPKDATIAVAERLGLGSEVLEARRPCASYGQGGVPILQHRLRSVVHPFVRRGFVAMNGRGIWGIAERGRRFLIHAKPGVVVSVFRTSLGEALWGEVGSTVAAVQDGALQLVFTSPPYPILRGRGYGTFTEADCIDLVVRMCESLRPKLTPDANLFLNLGNVTVRGGAASLYQQRLLIELCDRCGFVVIQPHYWVSTTKPPAGHYVTRTRTRLKDVVEPIYQLALTPRSRADNRGVLEPYGATMQRILRKGGDVRAARPSGHGHEGVCFGRDNGGAIPGNVQIGPNASSNSRYYSLVTAHRLQPHPARFPADLPERAIRLTTREGDVVGDFFGGSLTVPDACERLGRRWIAGEVVLDYLRGGELLFRGRPGYEHFATEGAVMLPPEWTRRPRRAVPTPSQATGRTRSSPL